MDLLLSNVRIPDLYRREYYKDKALYKKLKTNNTENSWIQKKMHFQLHRNVEDKTDRDNNSGNNMVYTFSDDNRRNFGLLTCGMLHLKRSKIKCMARLAIPSETL